MLQGAGGEAPAGLRSWIPRATYRLQVNKDFPLRQVTALVPYLDELGISHCYLSPLLTARPGSLHGYDITDHGSLNPEIAGMEDLEQFAGALKEHGMGLILDMVPNHMGIMGADNRWWLDVLENGPASRYAAYFDIDWHPLSEDLRGRVLLPVLGDAYGTVLENGGLRLVFAPDAGSFSVLYGEHRFPVDPGEYPRILARGAARLQARLGPGDAGFLEFQSLVTAFGHLPGRSEVSPEAVAERSRDKEVHKRHLAALCGASPDLAQFIEANLAELNGAGPGRAARTPGGPGLPPGPLARGRGRDQLPPLFRHQHPGGPAHGQPGGVREHAPAGAGSAGARLGERDAHRPPRRPVRPEGLFRAPAVHGQGAGALGGGRRQAPVPGGGEGPLRQ